MNGRGKGEWEGNPTLRRGGNGVYRVRRGDKDRGRGGHIWAVAVKWGRGERARCRHKRGEDKKRSTH